MMDYVVLIDRHQEHASSSRPCFLAPFLSQYTKGLLWSPINNLNFIKSVAHIEWKKGKQCKKWGGIIFISHNTHKVTQMLTRLSSPLVKHIHTVFALMKQTLQTLEPRRNISHGSFYRRYKPNRNLQ